MTKSLSPEFWSKTNTVEIDHFFINNHSSLFCFTTKDIYHLTVTVHSTGEVVDTEDLASNCFQPLSLSVLRGGEHLLHNTCDRTIFVSQKSHVYFQVLSRRTDPMYCFGDSGQIDEVHTTHARDCTVVWKCLLFVCWDNGSLFSTGWPWTHALP